MSRKIAVEGETVHYKASVARRLVRRGWACWVIEGAKIRRLLIRATPEPVPPQRHPTYIPDTLPPYELPGLKFQLPGGIPSQVRFLALAARQIAR